MGALLAKGLIAGAVVVGVGWLTAKGKTTASALLIQIPVISLGALWAAAAVSRENLTSVSGKMDHLGFSGLSLKPKYRAAYLGPIQPRPLGLGNRVAYLH